MHRRTGQPAPTFIQRHGLLIGTAVAAIAALAACTEEGTEVELAADPKAAYRTALDDARREAKATHDAARREAQAVHDATVREPKAALDATERKSKAAYDDALSKPKAAYVAAVKKWRRGWRPTSPP